MEIKESGKTEKSVKTTITKDFSDALNTIAQKSNRNESDIIRNAIEYYLKHNYPELIPKTEIEILNEVKAKYQFDKTLEEYRKDRYLVENIPVWENIIATDSNNIKEHYSKIEDLEGKLRVIGFGKSEEKTMLENQKNELEKKLINLKQSKEYYENKLAYARKGESFGAEFS